MSGSRILSPLMAVLLAAPLAVAAPRFPVTLACVASALATQQPSLPISELHMPAMTAADSNPELVVQAVEPTGKDEAKVRFACRAAGECLPFYVTVRGAGMSLAPLTATRPVTVRPHGPGSTAAPPAVRSGARATLLIDSGLLHLTLPVICLQGGDIGSEVRVTGLDHRMTYTARIVSPTELRESF